MLIRDNLIQALGPSRQVNALAAARGAEEIDAIGRVVMPSFIDLETSLAHARTSPRNLDKLLDRYDSPEPDVFREVLADSARALTQLSAQSLNRRLKRVTRTMAQYGTGTTETRAGYDLDESGAMKVLRVQNESDGPVNILSTLLLNLPNDADPGEWGRRVRDELLPQIRRRRLARFVDLEYDRERLPEPIAAEVLAHAAALGLGVKTHSDWFSKQSVAEFATAAEAISAGNLDRISPAGIERLASSSTIAVLNPCRTVQMGPRYAAPGRRLADAGAIVSLAAGYHPELSPGMSMQTAIYNACRVYGFRVEEAISAATVNNAHAVQAEDSVGSIEAGKRADILVLAVSDYRELGHSSGTNLVEKTIKNGKVIHDSGRHGGDDDE